jgi:hypothetical protein
MYLADLLIRVRTHIFDSFAFRLGNFAAYRTGWLCASNRFIRHDYLLLMSFNVKSE